MSHFDRDILVENINKLLKEKNVNKTELAKILDMSQPNVSKALNPKEKKCFTISQVFDLARHFHVSIDELVGNRRGMNSSISPRSTAAFITKLVENHDAEFIPYTRTEHIYTPKYDDQDGIPYSTQEDKEVTYPTILFPSYWYPDTEGDYDDICEQQSEAEQVGNDTSMLAVNTYLERFQEIFNIYEKGDLSKETYDAVIADLLSHLRE